MLEAQKQQHLRSLRRSLNRAVTGLKEGQDVVCHSGWGYGRVFAHRWLDEKLESEAELPDGDPVVLFPPMEETDLAQWTHLLPEGLLEALKFFWPGPLFVRLRPPTGFRRLTVTCPWHPLMQELLARHGPLFWEPLPDSVSEEIEEGRELSGQEYEATRLLRWPEEETVLESTLLDASTRPWRLLRQGFVGGEELQKYLKEPMILSQERAFPERAIRTYVPEGRTVIVEAQTPEEIPAAVQALRQQVPPDAFVRIYLDEQTAHNHFPDDREVRVYGELSDLERVRRRLQAMLERQNRRFGKRILLIAVSELGPGSESFRADLEKLSQSWLKVTDGVELQL